MVQTTNNMWGGRFNFAPNEIMEKINASIDFDKKLYKEDIQGSIVHCEMLAKQNIIIKEESEKIINGLLEIKKDIENNNFEFSRSLEDIHMNIESKLKEKIGDVAGKLHTARSRNDQVALDCKLYVRNAIDSILDIIKELKITILDKAEENYNVLMAGCTHLQVAQPTTFGHHLLCYYEMILRDEKRFINARNIMNECPLGSAALCGTPFDIDRQYTAEKLGFDCPTRNSLDSVSDRDFALEFLSCISILAVHLSRFAEECVIWTSQPYNYVILPEQYTTGSSIMPQKKNPDSCELIRGKTGRFFGNLIGLLTVMKGLPIAYQKDMQEDKEFIFDSFENIVLCLQVVNNIIKDIKTNKERMKEALNKGFPNATDLADYLVKKLNIPFRESHKITGNIVKKAEELKLNLEDLPLDIMKEYCNLIDEDVYNFINIENSLNSRKSYGGTASENVKEMIKYYRSRL